MHDDEKKNRGPDFIRQTVIEDTESGKYDGRIVTRFPPEPNGYLHIGHAKSINLNFGIAEEFNGTCHLRFDDTNPTKEEQEYIDSIKDNVKWLGFDWGKHEYYASDYFEQLYEYAVQLIKQGDAYVCDLSTDEIREYRGTLTEPGKESPHRDRSVEDNLDLFARMRAGEFEEGERVLRAKIDMAAPNIVMRDPVIYRILKVPHPRTGDAWCIYPMYDFTHCLSDSIEGITHSLCTLEFEQRRPLYDWVLDTLNVYHPQQIEFARLNVTFTVMSKRKLQRLVLEEYVNGWDDPRMPTLAGVRRRGYSPEALKLFCKTIGIAKTDSTVDVSLLEHCLRQDLNARAHRVMGVMNPLKVVIDNYPEDKEESLEAINNPEDESAGTRDVPFSRELWIEKKDFMEDPPKKFFRLGPGREVRLRYGYYITCTGFDTDPETGDVTTVHCTYDPETRGGQSPDGRKVKGTIHWVSARHAVEAEARLYDRLFTVEDPDDVPDGKDFTMHLNPDSLTVVPAIYVEPHAATFAPGCYLQFERIGYFTVDPDTREEGGVVFNQTVTLRDSWAKIEKKMKQQKQSDKK